MTEVQDEEHWLYGDDKGLPPEKEANDSPNLEVQAVDQQILANVKPDPSLAQESETNGELQNEANEGTAGEGETVTKDTPDDEDNSSDDDEPTVTIGKIVKQPDILRPPPPTHRAAPTSGLKDDDFNSAGKINGVPAPDFNLAELEEKPWRKPGADLADYFNYGFTEDTWVKYCERQKAMRVHESGVGLGSLGINPGKSHMGGPGMIPNSGAFKRIEMNGNENQPNAVNTIQVMTADRRFYSSKVLTSQPFDDMDFGGGQYGTNYFTTPPPVNFFNAPPPHPSSGWGVPPPIVPPPGWGPGDMGLPPPMPVPPPQGMGYYDKESPVPDFNSMGNEDRDVDSRERERHGSRDRDRRESRERESRRHRRRSRSRSRDRHRRRSRSRSRSKSPSSSHKHKRKKSKRERDTD